MFTAELEYLNLWFLHSRRSSERFNDFLSRDLRLIWFWTCCSSCSAAADPLTPSEASRQRLVSLPEK